MLNRFWVSWRICSLLQLMIRRSAGRSAVAGCPMTVFWVAWSSICLPNSGKLSNRSCLFAGLVAALANCCSDWYVVILMKVARYSATFSVADNTAVVVESGGFPGGGLGMESRGGVGGIPSGGSTTWSVVTRCARCRCASFARLRAFRLASCA